LCVAIGNTAIAEPVLASNRSELEAEPKTAPIGL